jgi:5,6-dimethylbenzimidazole synthase
MVTAALPMFLNELGQLFRQRRDVRQFRREPVPETLITQAIALADSAPSVGLSQPWRVLRVRDPQQRIGLRTNFNHANLAALQGYQGEERQHYAALKLAGFDQAPEYFLVFCETAPTQGKGLGRQSMPQTLEYSCVCMIQQFWLALSALGVGLGWVSILDPSTISEPFDAPASWRFIALLLVGFPEQNSDIPELEQLAWQGRTSVDLRWF